MTDARLADRRPSLCFVAHFAYGALSGDTNGHIGGVENQTSLMARWFAQRGYRISMLTWDEGQPDETTVDGVRVIKMCRRDAGLAGFQFFHPRWSSLNRAMRRAAVDIYYQNCAEYVTGQVALWCKRHGKRFVYSVASDPDCDPALPKMRTRRERLLYRYGLRNAERVIAQTHRQRTMLREGFGLNALVIPMPCHGPTDAEAPPPSLSDRKARHVLWVGRIAPVKRLEWLLDMAECPSDFTFEIVGPSDSSAYARELIERAQSLPNVVVRGPVAREDMASCYREAAVLCCTSYYEGFPNTFLEAWSHGTPVVSTVDPDGLIVERCLGGVGQGPSALISTIHSLIHAPARWHEASENGRRYYLENHTVDRVLPQFERVFFKPVSKAVARDPDALPLDAE